jgi:hypothetical protein
MPEGEEFHQCPCGEAHHQMDRHAGAIEYREQGALGRHPERAHGAERRCEGGSGAFRKSVNLFGKGTEGAAVSPGGRS